jgi:hypothetical protein
VSLDIDDLASDIATGIYGDDRMSVADLNAALSALAALVAEVARLREFRNAMHAGNDEVAEAVADERAVVVAWLRSEATERLWRQEPMDAAANAIERGEHRREEEK